MSVEIIVAIISSITTVIVAFLQFRKPSQRSTQTSLTQRNWKITTLLVILNLVTIVAAISWIYAGVVDIGWYGRVKTDSVLA